MLIIGCVLWALGSAFFGLYSQFAPYKKSIRKKYEAAYRAYGFQKKFSIIEIIPVFSLFFIILILTLYYISV